MGIKDISSIVSWGFKLISIFIIVKAFLFMLNAPIWGPVDEMSHMDYIEKISTGKIPVSGDTIEASVFNSIQQTQNMLPPNYDGTRKTLGIANLSYEEQQPPVYYFILSIPNKIMMMINMDIVNRIKILRIISFFLLTTGILLVLPIFKQLNKIKKFTTGKWIGSLGLLFSTLICYNNKHGLGNDVLSPLMVNLSILFFLYFSQKKLFKHFLLGCLFAALAFLTKYTNLIYTLLAFIIACIGYQVQSKEKRTKYLFTGLSCFLLIPIFIVVKYYILSKAGINGYKSSTNLFRFILPAGMVDFKTFLEVLFNDMFDFTFLGLKLKIKYYMCLVPIIFTVCITALKLRSGAPWIVYSIGLMFVLATMMFLLNKYVAGVHWFAFRHYMGYQVFWFISFLGFIPLLFTRKQST